MKLLISISLILILIASLALISASAKQNNFHPADLNHDWRINSTEVVIYSFNNGTYFSSADAIRLNNSVGAYYFDKKLTCPDCWVGGFK